MKRFRNYMNAKTSIQCNDRIPTTPFGAELGRLILLLYKRGSGANNMSLKIGRYNLYSKMYIHVCIQDFRKCR